MRRGGLPLASDAGNSNTTGFVVYSLSGGGAPGPAFGDDARTETKGRAP